MHIKRKLLATATTLVLVSGLCAANVATSAPALAARTPTVCTDGGMNNNGDCMNAWNGGSSVYAYAPGSSHENFSYQPDYRCDGSATVSSTCPFTDHGLDQALLNQSMIMIFYNGNNATGCVSDAGHQGFAFLGSCSESGGAFANLFVVARNSSLVSVGWTNARDAWVQLVSNGSSNQLVFGEYSNPTKWFLSS